MIWYKIHGFFFKNNLNHISFLKTKNKRLRVQVVVFSRKVGGPKKGRFEKMNACLMFIKHDSLQLSNHPFQSGNLLFQFPHPGLCRDGRWWIRWRSHHTSLGWWRPGWGSWKWWRWLPDG